MFIASGSYTGNGTATAVSGMVGAPRFVMVKGRTGGTNALMTIDTMTADLSKDMANTGAVFADGIVSLDANGFTTGADARCNTNAVVYDWLAIGGVAADIATGTYSGNSAANEINISPAFLPVFVYTVPVGASTVRPSWVNTTSAADSLAHNVGITAGFAGFTSLDADGFTMPSSATYNVTGTDYAYIALKAAPLYLSSFKYTGDGTDDRTITGAGFQPENVWTKNTSQTIQAAWKPKGQSTDASSGLQNATTAANIIQAFTADGFQVGSGAANTDTRVFYVQAFKDVTATIVGGGPGNSGNAPGRGRGNPNPGRGGGGGGGNGGGNGGGALLQKSFWGMRKRRTR